MYDMTCITDLQVYHCYECRFSYRQRWFTKPWVILRQDPSFRYRGRGGCEQPHTLYIPPGTWKYKFQGHLPVIRGHKAGV